MADTTELTFVEQFVHITAPPIPYLIVAGRSVYRAGDAHEKRTLPDTFDIILVHSGTLHITVGTDQVSVKPKGFLILPPGMRHGGYKPCERATIFSWMHFHCDGPVEYNNRPARQQVVRGNKNLYYRKNEFPVTLPVYGQLDDATYELVQSDFKEIEQALIDRYQRTKRFRQLRMSEIACQSLFLRILATIGEISINRGSEGDDDLPARVKRYMHDHYTLALTVREIARVFQCDPGYLSRIMNNRYGIVHAQTAHLDTHRGREKAIDDHHGPHPRHRAGCRLRHPVVFHEAVPGIHRRQPAGVAGAGRRPPDSVSAAMNTEGDLRHVRLPSWRGAGYDKRIITGAVSAAVSRPANVRGYRPSARDRFRAAARRACGRAAGCRRRG